MIKLIRAEQIKTEIEGEKVDFDRYNIEVKSQLSTKQYSIVVDYLNNEITGDCVAFGSWFDIELDECLELLNEVLKDNKPIRKINFIK